MFKGVLIPFFIFFCYFFSFFVNFASCYEDSRIQNIPLTAPEPSSGSGWQHLFLRYSPR